MGLTTWKGDRVRKGDVATSKNYLSPEEISDLNLLTTRFVDFAEARTRRRQQITIVEWIKRTDSFLEFDERAVVTGPGSVSADRAARVAAEQYSEFDENRRAEDAREADLEDPESLSALERAAERRVGAPDPQS